MATIKNPNTVIVRPRRNAWGNTGHVDEAGLRRLKWDDEDIKWLQSLCWWDEEDDAKWKVSEENIQLGGIITLENYKAYTNNTSLVFFPKLDKIVPCDNWTAPVAAIPTHGIKAIEPIFTLITNAPSLYSIGDLSGQLFEYDPARPFISYAPYLRSLGLGSFTIKKHNKNSDLYGLLSLRELDISDWDFQEGSSGLLDLSSCFADMRYLKSFRGVENIDTTEVTRMDRTFANTGNLEKINLEKWKVKNVVSMVSMFAGCGVQELTFLSKWNLNDEVDLNDFTSGCKAVSVALPSIGPEMKNTKTAFSKLHLLTTITDTASIIKNDISFAGSAYLSRPSCLVLFNRLASGYPGKVILNPRVLSSLTFRDIKIATDKGWTVTEP